MRLLNLLREIVHSPAFDVLKLLKQSSGMSVREICTAMDMSYMGIKQHCVELEKRRLVDTWRRPKKTGRPEKIYRLTQRAAALFPQAGNDFCLELLASADSVFGETAAQKLLFSSLQARGEKWRRLAGQGDQSKRLKQVMKLRADAGYLSTLAEAGDDWQLVDHHQPYGEIAERFDLVFELERECLEAILEVPVRQSVEEAGHFNRVVHLFPRFPTDAPP